MSLIRSLMGRRQFLATSGVTSVSALALGKLSNIVDPVLKTQIAIAADAAGATSAKGADYRYLNLLSPIKIGDKILKNRIFYPVSTPGMLNGPENFPADIMRSYYANVAKTAAVVTVRLETGPTPRKDRYGDSAHMLIFDLDDYGVQNYICQMIEGIHCMGALAVTDLDIGESSHGGMTKAQITAQLQGIKMDMVSTQETRATAPVNIGDIITAAKKMVDQGLDLVHIGQAVSINDDTAVGNAIKKMEAIKKNTNLITIMSIEGSSPGGWDDNLPEEAIALAKKFEGLVDIWRAGRVGGTTFSPEAGDPECLKITEAIKKSGVKTVAMAGGGFIYPDKNEEYIATGKCDLIALARPLLSDFDYGKKIYEGRGEDIVPCTLCQKCHGISFLKDWFSVCTVNPKLGIDIAVKVIDAPKVSKKVVVIGGGPAGMKAAITAIERGHRVTLYEKDSQLGGLLRRYADTSPYKWPYKAYKDYLVRQVNKLGIEVKLNTEATPGMIKKIGYDAVMVAIGSDPIMPRIPGVDGKDVYNVVDVFGKAKELGESVAFIGGGEFATESAIYLANTGINLTIMTGEKQLVVKDRPLGPNRIINVYSSMKNFIPITEAIVKGISGKKVTYIDSMGSEKSVQADSVVIFAGLKPKQDEALKFSGTVKKAVYVIGDCSGRCGNLQKATRSAFFMASQV